MEEQEQTVAAAPADLPALSPEELLPEATPEQVAEHAPSPSTEGLKAAIEAIVYVSEDPVTAAQIAAPLGQPEELVQQLLQELTAEYEKPEHGVSIREVAGGYKMATKAEHHDAVRTFVKSLKPPLKLSLAALETLAVIAYKQPITSPEVMEIRGVQGTGVLKTLLDRKLIVAAGRKNVIGKPVLYKTTKEFLVQFGLKDISELPSLKEFEEIRRMALPEGGAEMAEPATPRTAESRPESKKESGAEAASLETAAESEPEAEGTPKEEAAPEPGPESPIAEAAPDAPATPEPGAETAAAEPGEEPKSETTTPDAESETAPS